MIAKSLLDQVAFPDQRITVMEDQAIAALAGVRESRGVDASGEPGPRAGTSPGSPVLAAAHRLAEIPGISLRLAIVIIAEIGLNMPVFPTPAHLVSWMGLCRSAARSGTRNGKGKPKKGSSYARAAAGQAATGAARTATFPGQRYARIARRRGKAIARVAVARSIMIIVWHLLNDPAARYRDLGPDFYASRVNRDKKIRNHLRGLQAPGVTVAITADEQAAQTPAAPPRRALARPGTTTRPGPRSARPGAGPLPRSGWAGFTWSGRGRKAVGCYVLQACSA